MGEGGSYGRGGPAMMMGVFCLFFFFSGVSISVHLGFSICVLIRPILAGGFCWGFGRKIDGDFSIFMYGESVGERVDVGGKVVVGFR